MHDTRLPSRHDYLDAMKPSPLDPSSILRLPSEVVINILRQWAGTTVYPITADEYQPHAWHPRLRTADSRSGEPSTAIPDLAELVLPKSTCKWLYGEFLRYLWEDTTKAFTDPWELIAFHIACGSADLSMATSELVERSVPDTIQRSYFSDRPVIDKIRLEFRPKDYFAIFDVRVPPFDETWLDNIDPEIASAGGYLKHTKLLVLCFGSSFYDDANAWYDCSDLRWNETRLGNVPRYRPDVCGRGQLVDWILSYAWYSGYIQPIPEIHIEGDIQSWVREKWETIFRRHRKEPSFVFEVDIDAIQGIGMEELQGDEWWDPSAHYPPICNCEVTCSGRRQIKDVAEWDTVEGPVERIGTWAEEEPETKTGNWD